MQSILDNPPIQAPGIADGITPEQISTISRIVLGSIGSQGTVGGLVVAGIVSFNIINYYSISQNHRVLF